MSRIPQSTEEFCNAPQRKFTGKIDLSQTHKLPTASNLNLQTTHIIPDNPLYPLRTLRPMVYRFRLLPYFRHTEAESFQNHDFLRLFVRDNTEVLCQDNSQCPCSHPRGSITVTVPSFINEVGLAGLVTWLVSCEQLSSKTSPADIRTLRCG